MKELSIEEKAQRYDKAIIEFKPIYDLAKEQGRTNDVEKFERIFPELIESEDERIRKALTNWFKECHWDAIDDGKLKKEDIVAWLEKQGEQKYTDSDTLIQQRVDALANIVEPKFHECEWVIFNDNHESVYQVERIDNYRYYLRHYLGGTLSVHFDNELIRLWTIQDAKDGDVLTFKNNIDSIIICKSSTCYGIRSYCRLLRGDFINREESGLDSTLLIPATKEQRDTLERAMTNAGYRWDKEKLKLEKI